MGSECASPLLLVVHQLTCCVCMLQKEENCCLFAEELLADYLTTRAADDENTDYDENALDVMDVELAAPTDVEIVTNATTTTGRPRRASAEKRKVPFEPPPQRQSKRRKGLQS